MKKREINYTLTLIFREIFDNEKMIIKDTTNAKSIKSWDSFMQMNLILSIESKFSINFSSREIEKLKNVGGMIELIYKKKNE
tara:strand:+ start:29 stop:274 length:246 start_codon:yes stop_codon:yes gene_type:complete